MTGPYRIRALVFIGFFLAVLALGGLAYYAYRTMDSLVGRLEQAANPDPYYQALQVVMRTASTLDAKVRAYTVTQRPEELISEVRLTDRLRTQIDSLRSFNVENPRLDTIAALLRARVVLMDSIVEVIRTQEGPSAFAAFYDRLKSANEFRRRSRLPATADSTRSARDGEDEPAQAKEPGEPAPEDTLSAEAFARRMTTLGYELNTVRARLDAAREDSLKAAEKVAEWQQKVAERNNRYSRNRLDRWEESLREATILAASARADYTALFRQAEALTDTHSPEASPRKEAKARVDTIASTIPSQKLAKEKNTPKPTAPNLDRMLRQAEGMAIRDSLNRLEANTTFLRLTDRDMELTEKIMDHLEELDKVRQAAAENRADYARGLSGKTRQLAGIFGVTTLLILGLLLGIIFRDLNRNRRLQDNLAQAKARAEQLAKAKEEFLANMSHEIRTPMNAIIGFSEALGREDLSPRGHHSQQAIARSADHLLALLNDILDLSKLEAGQLKLEQITFSPEQVCRDVIMLYEQQARQKGLYLNLLLAPNLPVALVGDPLRLRQMLLNLVSNALKFTESGGVSLHARPGKTRNRHEVRMRFDVRDTGPGIAPEDQKRIFQAFEQAETSTTRQHGGTGLGLAITHRLAVLQQGKVSINSAKGEGATFTLSIPYTLGEEKDLPQELAEVPEHFSFRGMKVLAADDDTYNRQLLEVLLQDWGVVVTLVENGREAVEAAEKEVFDLVLLDIRMPEMNGLEAATRIRKRHPETPLVALTATATRQDREEARAVGMEAILLKPYKPAELAHTIRQLVSRDPEPAIPLPTAEPPATREHTPTAPGSSFDPTRLEKLANGNQGFVKKMLGVFVDNVAAALPAWEEARLAEDREALGALAHKLAPSVRQLGNTALHANLKALESEAAAPEPDSAFFTQAETQEKALRDMLEAVRKDLQHRP